MTPTFRLPRGGPVQQGVLPDGRRAGGRCDRLDECPRDRAGAGEAFEADAARGAVSSRRKTIRAVIMRTIIDGSTADIRKSPDWIVLSMQAGDGVDQEATCRTFAEPVAVKFASSPATTSGPRRARDIESVISLKLRQHRGRHKINGRCDIGATQSGGLILIIPGRLDGVLPDRAARHGDDYCLKSKASPHTYLASKAYMNAAAASALPIII